MTDAPQGPPEGGRDWPLGSQETGDGPDRSPHQLLNPDTLAPPVGFSHAVVAGPGRLVFLGGQTAHGPDDALPPGAWWSSSRGRAPTW